MTIEQGGDHFRGHSALQHVAESRAKAETEFWEEHCAEIPSVVFAFANSLCDSIVVMVFLIFILDTFSFQPWQKGAIFVGVLAGLCVWKGARGAFLSWSRLRRMHTIASEERKEIECHRQQEREELVALYSDKGLSGPLLDNVVDVLMADQERLLRIMLQEEMGLHLEERVHPLIQGLSAAAGACASLVLLPCVSWLPVSYTAAVGVTIVSGVGLFMARATGERGCSAFVWNGMIAAVSFVIVHACLEILAV